MKIGSVLYLFLGTRHFLLVLIFLKSNSESVATYTQTLQAKTFSHKLNFLARSANKKCEDDKTINHAFPDASNPDAESLKKKNLFKIFHISDTKPNYEIAPKKNMLSEQLGPLNGTTQRNLNYLHRMFTKRRGKRELYLDSYYPTFYHRPHFDNYRRSLYYPHFYRNAYGSRNVDKQFINRKEDSNILFENQDIYPQDIMQPYLEKSMQTSRNIPSFSLLVTPHTYEKLAKFSTSPIMIRNGTTKDVLRRQKGSSSIKSKILDRAYRHFENKEISETLDESNAETKNQDYKEIRKRLLTDLKYPETNKNRTLNSHSVIPEFTESVENERSSTSPLHILRVRFERAKSALKKDKLKNFPFNRVYFEKIPTNLNLSWFVYVNCSRDECLLSNDSTEIELLNAGWILHNCTNYGCSEIYPRTESMRKFIGLLLLAFSLCILKILVFLIVFYYCRHLKLSSKRAAEDKDLAPWNDDLPSSSANEMKSPKIDQNKDLTRNVEDLEPTFFYHKDDDNKNTPENNRNRARSMEDFGSIFFDKNKDNNEISENFKEPDSIPVEEIDKNNSKIWTPPNQNVLARLQVYVANKNAEKTFIKKSNEIKNYDIPKSKKRHRSNIPRLKKHVKCDERSNENEGKMNVAKNHYQKYSKADKPNLLVNIDDEMNHNNLCSSGNTEKTTNWSSILEKECNSFISLNLND